MSSKLRLAVLFGGCSVEHEISIITALQAIGALDTTRYEVTPVYIDQNGRWYTGKSLLHKSTFRNWGQAKNELREVTLLPRPDLKGFVALDSFPLIDDVEYPVDACLMCFHGRFGEDGCVQGLLELAGIPYTSCGVLASALSMNKELCKAAFAAHGIPSLPSIRVTHADCKQGLSGVLANILSTPGLEQFPLFVKPCHLGSSIGIGRASTVEELVTALARVFQYEEFALVEPCIADLMEINVSVLRTREGLRCSPCEIPVPSKEALTFEDKYLRGGKAKGGSAVDSGGMAGLTRVIDSQELDANVKQQVKAWALQAYELIDAKGVVRFDFMMDLKSGKLFFNELNPQPGSLSFYLWEKADPPLLYTELLDEMIEACLSEDRREVGRKQTESFRALSS